MDNGEEREDFSGGDQGKRSKAEIVAVSTARRAEPKLAFPSCGDIKLALQLYGRGSLSIENVRDLKHLIADCNRPSGYGFLFEYVDGELNLGLEECHLPANGLGADPPAIFESDLKSLIATLPAGFQFEMKAAITVETSAGKVRQVFKAKNGKFKKTMTISSIDSAGCSSDVRLPWLQSRWFNYGVIVVGVGLIVILYYMKIFRLK